MNSSDERDVKELRADGEQFPVAFQGLAVDADSIGDYELAELFHSTYGRLAPNYGLKTREASAVPFRDLPLDDKRLMLAVAVEVKKALGTTRTQRFKIEVAHGYACAKCSSVTSEQCMEPPALSINPGFAFGLVPTDEPRVKELLSFMSQIGWIVQSVTVTRRQFNFTDVEMAFAQGKDPRVNVDDPFNACREHVTA